MKLVVVLPLPHVDLFELLLFFRFEHELGVVDARLLLHEELEASGQIGRCQEAAIVFFLVD